jgi:hypothetical protein
MSVISIPKPLRDVLGEEAVESFIKIINNVDNENRKEAATKADLLQVKTELSGQITLLRWMIGFVLAINVSIALKIFFIH